MTTLTISPADIQMTTCLDITNLKDVAIFCEHNGKLEKYWVKRGKSGYLFLMLVSNQPIQRNVSMLARDEE